MALRETYAGKSTTRAASFLTNSVAKPWADVAAELLAAPPRAPIDIGWVSSWDVRCGVAEYSRHLIEAMPASPAVGRVTVLCDKRTGPESDDDADPRVLPCWELGAGADVQELAKTIAIEDPRVVVVQHQPGLIDWDGLAALLNHAALRDRLVVTTLHSTLRLMDAPDADRSAVLDALSGIARVAVHTIDDLNRLKAFGLSENVMLIPQGAPDDAKEGPAPRRLLPGGAPVIGCYGFFLPDKGIPQLIEAVRLLRETYSGVRLLLVNADYGSPDSRAEIAACRSVARMIGVADAIEWHTTFLPHEESRALLLRCDVIVLPYQASKEASSAALRTALGAGVPAMVTPLPLFDEAGEAVQRAPGFDGPALAAGLGELLADAEARAALQRGAAAWRRQRAWPVVARRLQGILVGLAASNG